MLRIKQRGIALITAMWVMVVLLIMVGGFAAMAHCEAEVARNFGSRMSDRWAARAAMRDVETQVLTLVAQPYTVLGGTSQLVISGPITAGTLGSTTYTATIQDEAGKLNINTASSTTLAAFFPSDVADNIVAWRSASTALAVGAEDSYYNALNPPYQCKHAPFDTVNELLLVDGVTSDMLAATVTADGLTLGDVLTTCSVDANTDALGGTRVNVNTATLSALYALFTRAESQAIITRRSRTPFSSPADLVTVPGLSKLIWPKAMIG